MTSVTSWSPFEEKRIRYFAGRGYSAERIRCELLPEFNRGRSAIVAFCRRMGIHLQGKKGSVPGVPRPRVSKVKNFGWVRKRHEFIEHAELPEIVVSSAQISLMEASDGQCRWIIGSPRNQTCCGAKAPTGDSYCRDHALICFAMARPRAC